jgi:hypothetical protein
MIISRSKITALFYFASAIAGNAPEAESPIKRDTPDRPPAAVDRFIQPYNGRGE